VVIAYSCLVAREAVVETPLLLLSVSPTREGEHHQEACNDKSKENGETIELGEGDEMRLFQAQQAKGKEKKDTSNNEQRPHRFHRWLLSSISRVYHLIRKVIAKCNGIFPCVDLLI